VDDEAIAGVHVSGDGYLGYRNDVSGEAIRGNTLVSMDTWHSLEVRIVVNGSDGAISISLDGALIGELTGPEDFGSAPIGWIQLGENSPGPTFEVLFANFEIGGLHGTPSAGPIDRLEE
jgi:hypothetical protein